MFTPDRKASTSGSVLERGGSREFGPVFGCQHLQSAASKTDAIEDLSKHYTAILNTVHGQVVSTSQYEKEPHLKPSTGNSSLRPQYGCLLCSRVASLEGFQKHASSTQHSFAVDVRNRAVFCHQCNDLVYDDIFANAEKRSRWANAVLAPNNGIVTESSILDDRLLRANTSVAPCRATGLRGLYNLGNTCFMSVIIQSMIHNPVLRNHYLADGHNGTECTQENCLGCALDDLFTDISSNDKEESIGPTSFLSRSWLCNPSMAGYKQQDAHEYFIFFVNKLHSFNGGTADDGAAACKCIIHRTFYGKLRSDVTCGQCHNITTTEDLMVDLSLDLQSQAKRQVSNAGSSPVLGRVSLESCLESFTKPEKLQSHGYRCRKCNSPQKDPMKQLCIKKLPQILCIQFKRFEASSATAAKVEVNVTFPFEIDMAPYTSAGKRQGKASKSGGKKLLYDLFCVVVHIGSMSAGHYICYVRKGHQWFLFDDSKVLTALESEVLAANAYLLFYIVKNLF